MRTLVVGAAIVDLMMKVERLPKSGEDIPCKGTNAVVSGYYVQCCQHIEKSEM